MTPRRVAASVVFAATVSLIGCAGGSSSGDDGARTGATGTTATPNANDTTGTNDTTNTAGVEPVGFTTVQARITEADGMVCEVCMWLADNGDERGRGLMGVTDLGDAVAMVFQFQEPTAGAFYMFQTPTPLSIAWFDPTADFVGSADMAPCLDTPAGDCPLYSPDAAYSLGVEVFDGGLEPLGLGEGSRLDLIDGSEAERCPLAGV